MLCQWCHLVARSTMQMLRLQAVRRRSFHMGARASSLSASSALTDWSQQKPGSPKLRQCVGTRQPDMSSQRTHLVTGPRILMSKCSDKMEACGRRWLSSDSDNGRGRGYLDGTPPAGQYRSPWTILKEEFKV